jgi:hypothetical protein
MPGLSQRTAIEMAPAEKRPYIPCTCKVCNGELVDPATASRHAKSEKRAERTTLRMAASSTNQSIPEQSIEDLSNEVIRMALNNQTSSFHNKRGDAMWQRDTSQSSTRGSPPLHNIPDRGPAPAKQSPKKSAVPTDHRLYQELVALDQELDARIKEIAQILGQNDTSTEADAFSIDEGEDWISQKLLILRSAKPKDDVATKVLMAASIARIEKQLLDIEEWRKTRVPEPQAVDGLYNTGELEPYHAFDIQPTTPTDKFFQPIRTGNRLIALAMFIVVVLNLIGQVPRRSCNWVLATCKILVSSALEDEHGVLSPANAKLMEDFPADLRSVRRNFDLEPDTVIYATCPRCCFTHAPILKKTKNTTLSIYPPRCKYVRFQGGRPCGAALTRRRVHDGQSVRAPIRPFAYQTLSSFTANLLSRPGIEDMIDRAWNMQNQEELWDIWDGSAVRELEGPDKKPFSQGPESEARIVWNLSVDWFNPFLNKQAGKSVSTGCIVMSCANLPPSVRNDADNLYLAGIIPGPREPQTDQINHFLRPLVDELLPAWKDGTNYSRTYRHLQGRTVRSALCALVADMPGRQKVAGGSAGFLAPFNSMQRKKDVNNIFDHVSNSCHLENYTYTQSLSVDMGPQDKGRVFASCTGIQRGLFEDRTKKKF